MITNNNIGQRHSTKSMETQKLDYIFEGIIPGTPKPRRDKAIFGKQFDNYEKKINCIKIAENELTKRKDLFVKITFSQSQYTVETSPLGYSVIRKLSDFEILYKTIPKFNYFKFNPLLPKFPSNLDDNSEEKVLFLNYYLNALIEDSYYRSLPIVFNFINLPQIEWDKRVRTYQKVKEITEINKIFNIEDYFNIKINDKNVSNAMKIKDDIKKTEEIYKKLNDNWDELFPIMEKMSICLKKISENYAQLKNIYNKSDKCNEALSNCFQQLCKIFNNWSDNYIKQKNLLKIQFKYFFKYINIETNSFLKNIENYENKKDEYLKVFKKYKGSHTSRDREYLEQKRDLFGLHLINVIDEYQKLSERQGKRLNKQFFLYNNEKETIFQDFSNFYKLFNFKIKNSLIDEVVSNIGNKNDILNINQNKISKISKLSESENIINSENISNNEISLNNNVNNDNDSN